MFDARYKSFVNFDAEGDGNGDGGDTGDKDDPLKGKSTPTDVEGLKALVAAQQATIKRVNAEAAARRVALKAFEDAEAVRLAAELTDLEKATTHVETLTAEKSALTSRAEAAEAQTTRYTAATQKLLDARVEALGAAAKTAVGALPEAADALQRLEWLGANEELFSSPRPGTPTTKTAKRKPEGEQDPKKGRRDFTARF